MTIKRNRDTRLYFFLPRMHCRAVNNIESWYTTVSDSILLQTCSDTSSAMTVSETYKETYNQNGSFWNISTPVTDWLALFVTCHMRSSKAGDNPFWAYFGSGESIALWRNVDSQEAYLTDSNGTIQQLTIVNNEIMTGSGVAVSTWSYNVYRGYAIAIS